LAAPDLNGSLFCQEFGFKVYGIDYSEIAVSKQEKFYQIQVWRVMLYVQNFFFTPRNLIDAFDVVVSFGVVEHFEDTAAGTAFSRFLKPNGILQRYLTWLDSMV